MSTLVVGDEVYEVEGGFAFEVACKALGLADGLPLGEALPLAEAEDGFDTWRGRVGQHSSGRLSHRPSSRGGGGSGAPTPRRRAGTEPAQDWEREKLRGLMRE